ncbi:phosphoribosylamine--glycine ligase [Rubritalea spongiae]|uniref:Phosphoribosylamine--glycine ligase n=1 Tax=Rubritalea spongiae TaxID=430797 RepID=A0ABW5E3V3_9BACT
MKILVVGKGGREHALLTAFNESPTETELYSFPGSDAIAEIATRVDVDGLEELIKWMLTNKIDLCVAGEESYLVTGEGLANLCEKEGIPCWGPHFQSAQLEASKEFAKEFMLRHDIPTGAATGCANIEEARAAINGVYPTVLKFDGLAAGKGVAVCPDEATAEEFLNEVLVERRFGEGRLLVEECLVGPEVSVFAAVVDDKYLIFTPARDYKRALDGDRGPNTGGMGAVASRQLVSQELLGQIEQQIVKPTVDGLVKDGLPYRGFIYFGLMITEAGPKIIEYNCRFGDPECQAVMPIVGGDLAQFCFDGAKGALNSDLLSFGEGWSVCLVRASAGYPETSRSGDVITGFDAVKGARVYHAGTRKNDKGEWETNGGRVLAVVAGGADRASAVEAAYVQLEKVTFPGMQSRTDIGTFNF